MTSPGALPATISNAVQEMLSSPAEQHLFINGTRQPAADDASLATYDPASGQLIAYIADAGAPDIDRAVAGARQALKGPWGGMTPRERNTVLLRIAELIEAHIEELAELETLDQGKPWSVSRWAEIPATAHQFRYFAGQALAIEGHTLSPSVNYQPPGREIQAWTLREPVGVIAAITPWNSPLVLTAMKLAPALAAGCTVVHKPAELTSLSALRLAELMCEAGLPDGVVNVVTGTGARAGALLASHTGVDKVVFTGSTTTGRAIVESSKTNLKRISLELGGKSPALVLADADPELVIPGVANAIFFNAGQVCVANARAYIHRSIFDEVVEGIAAYGARMRMGHGLDRETEMGPVVSPAQAEKIEGYIGSARRAGATVLAGGERLGANGTFIQPTIITGTDRHSPIHCDEVFGPVLVAEPFDETGEALAWSNDTHFGLAASVWTRDFSNGLALSRQLETGTVWINTHSMFDPALPIGGIKQSGYGRDSGRAAMDNYLEWKTVCAVV